MKQWVIQTGVTACTEIHVSFREVPLPQGQFVIINRAFGCRSSEVWCKCFYLKIFTEDFIISLLGLTPNRLFTVLWRGSRRQSGHAEARAARVCSLEQGGWLLPRLQYAGSHYTRGHGTAGV